jgi:hypothetical protein
MKAQRKSSFDPFFTKRARQDLPEKQARTVEMAKRALDAGMITGEQFKVLSEPSLSDAGWKIVADLKTGRGGARLTPEQEDIAHHLWMDASVQVRVQDWAKPMWNPSKVATVLDALLTRDTFK